MTINYVSKNVNIWRNLIGMQWSRTSCSNITSKSTTVHGIEIKVGGTFSWRIRPKGNILSLTLTRASDKLVHMAISSLVDISGYRFRANVASNSCNCWDVKCVRCRLWRFVFFPSLSSESLAPTTDDTPVPLVSSCFISVGPGKRQKLGLLENIAPKTTTFRQSRWQSFTR